MEFILSNHAIDRFKQRFRLKFGRSNFQSKELQKSLMLGQLTTARRLDEWKRSPFYRNKMSTKYSPNTELFEKSGVIYICESVGVGKMFVRTCVQSIMFYKF